MEKKDYKLTAPCVVEGISTRSDHSWKVVLGLPELSIEDGMALLSLNRISANILISPTEITQGDIESVDNIDSDDMEFYRGNAKTKSQRLRNVLYRKWESDGSKGVFKDYYNQKMEGLIDLIKSKLD